MNRGQLISMVSKKFSLVTDVGSDELALQQIWANEGVVEVLLKTHCYVELGDMALTAGVDTYRLDNAVLAIKNKRITSQGQNYSFRVVPWEDVFDAQRGVNVVGAWPQMLAIEGTLMVVWPAPVQADSIRFLYVPRPSPMTDDSHDPSVSTYGGIPEEYHRAIQYYMNWQAAEYDDKGGPLGPKDYKTIFEDECNLIKKRLRNRRQRGISGARVGYPGARGYPDRNDVYPGGRN